MNWLKEILQPVETYVRPNKFALMEMMLSSSPSAVAVLFPDQYSKEELIKACGYIAEHGTGFNIGSLLNLAVNNDDIDVCHSAIEAVFKLHGRYEWRYAPKESKLPISTGFKTGPRKPE